MAISVNYKNGNRYGTFKINGIEGTFPTQSITSTNLNHRDDYFDDKQFNFKTNIVEIIEPDPEKLINDSEYRESRSKIISKMIDENPNYLFLFTLRGARDNKYKRSGHGIIHFKFTKANNESLIKFQKECGFPLIKVFFKLAKDIEDSEYYRTLIPEDRFVASLDENMYHDSFRTLYQECIAKQDQIISFFGRVPSKNKKQINNQSNFAFLVAHPDDQILRLASFIQKSITGVVSSLVYNYFGIDAYSFWTREGPQNTRNYQMRALDGFRYKLLEKDTTLICPITEKNLYESAIYFKNKYNKSSIPLAIHDIVRLNERFEKLPERYTREEIREILGDRI